jgi:hypothetical protein
MNFLKNISRGEQIAITIVVFLIFLILPLCIGLMYYHTGLTLKQQISSQLEGERSVASSAIQIKLNHLTDIASSMAALPKVTADATAGQWTGAADAIRDAENAVSFYDTYIDRVVLFDGNGVEQSAYPTLTGGIGTNASNASWYAAARQTGTTVVSSVTKRGAIPSFDIIDIATPIKNDNTIVGFIVLQIPTRNFLDFNNALSMGTYGFSYIVDSEGNIVAHPRYSSSDLINLASSAPVKNILAGQSGTMITSNTSENQDNFLVYGQIPNYNWGIVIQEPYDDIFAPYESMMKTMEIVEVMLGAIDILICYLVFRFIDFRRKKAAEMK